MINHDHAKLGSFDPSEYIMIFACSFDNEALFTLRCLPATGSNLDHLVDSLQPFDYQLQTRARGIDSHVVILELPDLRLVFVYMRLYPNPEAHQNCLDQPAHPPVDWLGASASALFAVFGGSS